MAQLWGGRFTKETDQLVYNFNASIEFDKKFYRQDMLGSMAHVKMLAKQGILTEEEKEKILKGIEGILEDVEKGRLEISEKYEDIHSFVEAVLIERIGEAGKKLHTGRSRNDQVALDMKLYIRDEIGALDELLQELLETILEIMKEHIDTFMPGFTHLQKAQPITLAHHMGAYFEMFFRDRGRLSDIYRRMNYCPLGAGALAGTTYPLDREYTAELLGFFGPTLNSMDSVSDRDYVIELLSAMSTIMMHLSRFCEEIIIWNSNEYRFVEIDDTYSTGSSIMPQKKNPDIAELVRGKTGRVYGALVSLLTTMKGIPLAYNKDMQEDKELTFDAIDTVKGCVKLFNGMLKTMQFNKERMYDSAGNGFTNATDAADYLVNKGVPFRDAHGIVGQLVLFCLDKKISLSEMTLEEYKAISPVFEEDIYEAVSLETCVNKRLTIGAPGQESMKKVINICESYLVENKKCLSNTYIDYWVEYNKLSK
ncbi:MAG: argininosuccinate lyase [Lachnospiraceae bacterium]|nr:argininosuccinate lyase [Lachnospiraceae bacterium]